MDYDALSEIRQLFLDAEERHLSQTESGFVGIIDAILKGDCEEACKKLWEHIQISHRATIKNFLNSDF